jgi:uncharacterized protein (DUF1501 family)
MNTRRVFLRNSALAMVGVGSAPLWLERALYAADRPSPRKKILVAIFQRGAADGLNVVVPHGEKAYYDLRPTIAVPRPTSGGKREDAAIDLDGFFGLHPSLEPLQPLFDQRSLAIVDAVGSPDPTRSHFDAQDYMESGTPGLKATDDGWMNRALPKEPGKVSPVRAIALGPVLPRAMRGPQPAIALQTSTHFRCAIPRPRGSSSNSISNPPTPLSRLLAGRHSKLSPCCNRSRNSPTTPPAVPNTRAAASATVSARWRN